jgi:hypothetical protein
VLDYIRCTILAYSPAGDFLRQIGRQGSGPGEMLSPAFIEIVSDGSICVVDENGWLVFDSTGTHFNSQVITNNAIQHMTPVGLGDIVGIQSSLVVQPEAFVTTKHICRWHYLKPDSIVTEYFSKQFVIDRNNFASDLVTVDMFPMLFTAGNGFVCVAPDPQKEPVLIIYNANGMLIDSLILPYPEVPKTPEELEEERCFIEEVFYYTTNQVLQVDWEPYPLRPMIKTLGVDQLNRIWVQRGIEQYPCFDVYNSFGEHQLTAILFDQDDTSEWLFHISPQGIIAVPQNPEFYYIIYFISELN